MQNALSGIIGDATQATDIIGKVAEFGISAANAIYEATGIPLNQWDQAAQDAVFATRYNSNQNIDAVLSAIQLLLQKLNQQGLGTTFQINQAPRDDADNRQELTEMISYLNALYA